MKTVLTVEIPVGVEAILSSAGYTNERLAEEAQRALREAFKIVFRAGLTVSHALDRVSGELPQSKELDHFIDFCRKTERGIAR